VDEEPEFWFPDVWRGRPVNAKQGSNGVVTKLTHQPGHEDLWGDIDNQHHPTLHVEYTVQCALDMYNLLLQSNVAPEQARMVLPQNTMTEWIWSGSLAAFARVCKLRLDPHAQQETSEVAEKIGNLTAERFPVSFAALMEN
jgi:thymidylate synthase (FAD)